MFPAGRRLAAEVAERLEATQRGRQQRDDDDLRDDDLCRVVIVLRAGAEPAAGHLRLARCVDDDGGFGEGVSHCA
jgi:hypothetical protein